MRKALSYILAIHVPVAGLATIPVLCHSPLVLHPVHLVFLELLIDPSFALVFEAEPEEWIRYYSVPVSGTNGAATLLTPGDGMVETAALSRDGASLFYGTNAGDIDRRHIWKVPAGGGRAVWRSLAPLRERA